MKILLIILMLLPTVVEARNVGRGSAVGSASSASGQGSKYTLGDEYQPWPQAEMRQYAKEKFVPYNPKEDEK